MRARERRTAHRRGRGRYPFDGAVHRRRRAREARALRSVHRAHAATTSPTISPSAEGVSHFVYVAWNTGYDKPVTLLELELQAEVDKYVLCAWLLREQGAGRFPRELHRVLFERARVDPVAAAGRIGLYHTASNYAARFCRRVAALLERKRHGVTRDLMAELRRFYRWGNVRKMRHIERYA